MVREIGTENTEIGTENTELGIRRGGTQRGGGSYEWGGGGGGGSKGIELHFTGWQDRGNKWVA